MFLISNDVMLLHDLTVTLAGTRFEDAGFFNINEVGLPNTIFVIPDPVPKSTPSSVPLVSIDVSDVHLVRSSVPYNNVQLLRLRVSI